MKDPPIPPTVSSSYYHQETVPEHQSPLRQTAQQLFPPGCESPELNSHRRSLKPHTNPLPPETWTTPPSLPHHKKNCQTFLFNSKCAKQVSVPVQTTCSNTLSSICTRRYCVYIIPQKSNICMFICSWTTNHLTPFPSQLLECFSFCTYTVFARHLHS